MLRSLNKDILNKPRLRTYTAYTPRSVLKDERRNYGAYFTTRNRIERANYDRNRIRYAAEPYPGIAAFHVKVELSVSCISEP